MPKEGSREPDPWEAIPGTGRSFEAGSGGWIDVYLAQPKDGAAFSYGAVNGVVDRESLSAATRHLAEDPRFGARRPTLWDVRDQDFEHTPVVSFRGYAFIFTEFPERSGVRRGYLVGNDIGYGILRMFQNTASGYGLEDEGLLHVSANPKTLVAWLQT